MAGQPMSSPPQTSWLASTTIDTSHPQLNPSGMMPLGPELSLNDPSARAEL